MGFAPSLSRSEGAVGSAEPCSAGLYREGLLPSMARHYRLGCWEGFCRAWLGTTGWVVGKASAEHGSALPVGMLGRLLPSMARHYGLGCREGLCRAWLGTTGWVAGKASAEHGSALRGGLLGRLLPSMARHYMGWPFGLCGSGVSRETHESSDCGDGRNCGIAGFAAGAALTKQPQVQCASRRTWRTKRRSSWRASGAALTSRATLRAQPPWRAMQSARART